MIAVSIKTFMSAARAFAVFTLLTGFFYPILVTGFAKVFFPEESKGSLITHADKIIGSSLLAQKFSSPRYFWPRPSASDFATIPSGASNLSPTSEALKTASMDRLKLFGEKAPPDLLTASGSGLDPHLSADGVVFQVERIISSRGISPEALPKLMALIQDSAEPATWGFLGKPRLNILELNLKLDQAFP